MALLLRDGSNVKALPWVLETVADFSTTLTVAELPELIVIVPRLTVGEVVAVWRLLAEGVPIAKLVTAFEAALTDSITSAVICPMATV